MKPVQNGRGEVTQWGVSMGKQGGGGCSASLGVKKTGLRGGGESGGEPGPVKTGNLAKIEEICSWTTFSGENRFESADGGF